MLSLPSQVYTKYDRSISQYVPALRHPPPGQKRRWRLLPVYSSDSPSQRRPTLASRPRFDSRSVAHLAEARPAKLSAGPATASLPKLSLREDGRARRSKPGTRQVVKSGPAPIMPEAFDDQEWRGAHAIATQKQT